MQICLKARLYPLLSLRYRFSRAMFMVAPDFYLCLIEGWPNYSVKIRSLHFCGFCWLLKKA